MIRTIIMEKFSPCGYALGLPQRTIAFVLAAFFILPCLSFADTELTGCSQITQSGIYTLSENITNSHNDICIEILASNVKLYCNGNTIGGVNKQGSIGILAARNQIEAYNCTIKKWGAGIKREGSNIGFDLGHTISENKVGVSYEYAESNVLRDSAMDKNEIGVHLSFSSRGEFSNNFFNNTKNTEIIGIGRNNWNYTRDSYMSGRIYSEGLQSGGNYWSGPNGGWSENCIDSNRDGFCDSPYELASENTDYLPLSNKYVPDTVLPSVNIDSPRTNSIVNSTKITATITANDDRYRYTVVQLLRGTQVFSEKTVNSPGTFTVELIGGDGGYYNISATAWDWDGNSKTIISENILTPLEIGSCRDLSIQGATYYLKNNIAYPQGSGSVCLNIKADDITLDCKGMAVRGTLYAGHTIYGIALNERKRVKVRNCLLESWDYGILMHTSTENEISGSTFQNNREAGIYMHSSGNNRIYNNHFKDKAGIIFGGQYIKNSWNIGQTIGKRVYSSGRYIGGNYWSGPTGGYSDSCEDKDTDGFCDKSYDLATANSPIPTGSFIERLFSGLFFFTLNSGLEKGVNVDNFPLSPKYVPDTAPPITTATAKLPNSSSYGFGEWTSSEYVTLTLACSDGYGSGCKRTYYCTDSSNSCLPGYIYKNPIKIEFSKDFTEIVYFRYFSVDEEDNQEKVNTSIIKSASSAQKLTLVGPADGSYTNNKSATWKVSILKPEELESVQFIVKNSTGGLISNPVYKQNTTYNATITLLADGNYTVEAIFNDIYGAPHLEAKIGITLDTKPPEITLFELTPESVFVGETITSLCRATDIGRGEFAGSVSGIDTSSAGTKSALCVASDYAGNTAQKSLEYLVKERICREGEYRCQSNNLEFCSNNVWELYRACKEGDVCNAQERICKAKQTQEPPIVDPGPGNETKPSQPPKPLEPSIIFAGIILGFVIITGMALIYVKVFSKSKKDYTKQLAIIENKVREAEKKGKNTEDVRKELETAEEEANIGLSEMVGPRLKKINKMLKELK